RILPVFGSWKHIASPPTSVCPEFLDPFPLFSGFPETLDGRHSVGYFGSAIPAQSIGDLSTYPHSGKLCTASGFHSHSMFSVSRRCPSVPLRPASRPGKLVPPDKWSCGLHAQKEDTLSIGSWVKPILDP